jgi:deoxyadenosine/deoxycytidine kinase
LFGDPARWAFETQLAFLLQKSLDIMKALDRGASVVLDRSLEEDIHVFAKYFRSVGAIDNRAAQTYDMVAQYFTAELPAPDVVLYCQCSVNTALERIAARKRHDKKAHSMEHLEQVNELYTSWLTTYRSSSIYALDSETWDWREPVVFHRISRELEGLYEDPREAHSQLDLFAISTSQTTIPNIAALEILRPIHETEHEALHRRAVSTLELGPLPYPSAYIAAPFTAFAKQAPSGPHELFSSAQPHGSIGRGKFRKTLLQIERVLSAVGIRCLIPHRDVNQWGKRLLEPCQVTALCTEQVSRCDLFVGILGDSHGSHYEFGIARAQGKPCIIVHCRELGESFIATGIMTDGHTTLSITCERLTDVPVSLGGDEVNIFLDRFF